MAPEGPRPGRVRSSKGLRRRSSVWVMVASWLILVGGVAGATVSAAAVTRTARTQSVDAFDDTAEVIRSVVSSRLALSLSLIESLQGLVASQEELTNSEFLEWYETAEIGQRFPGGVGFAYVERVPVGEVDAFGAEVLADPIHGRPAEDSYQVFPPRSSGHYCLQRLGVWRDTVVRGFPVPLGFDFCAADLGDAGTSALPAILREATAAGHPATVAPELLGGETFAFFGPVYSTGADPGTEVERLRASRGWTAASFDVDALLGDAFARDEGIEVEVVHVDASGTRDVIAMGGRAPVDPDRSVLLPVRDLDDWYVRVTGNPPTSGATPTEQGVFVWAATTAFVLLLVLTLRIVGRSRERALDLVDDTTAELAHRALHDALTDLPNRARLMEIAAELSQRCSSEGTSLAVLFVDLDHFKSVNDTLGHAAGDELLRAVAARIRSSVRDRDVVGRLGGDEFVVLVDGTDGSVHPEQVARRVLAALERPFSVAGTLMPVSVSIGVAVGPRDDPEQLLRDADVAMYEAKAAGRNRAVLYTSAMGEALGERAALEWELHDAAARGELAVQFQPTVELRSGRVVGLEALVRWHHPTRGLLPPDEFIPLAEESGLVVGIGRWVLAEACERGAEWWNAGWQVRVAVNVSGRQLVHDTFPDDVRDALASTGFPPQQLVLELTESALMQETETVLERLDAFKELGICLAVDDFGTGYSSMSYLQRFPVDALKVDRSFVARVADSPRSIALLRGLVHLGSSLGLLTVAEGIETPGELAELMRSGCDAGQGYLFSRPLDADDVEAYLVERHAPRHAPPKPAAAQGSVGVCRSTTARRSSPTGRVPNALPASSPNLEAQ